MSLAFALALALSPVAEDPRLELQQLRVAGDDQQVLIRIDELLQENPEGVRPLGIDFLRGYLLVQQGKMMEAQEALGHALETAPDIYPYSRYYLALQQERVQHPEVAAGLVATLLRDGAPPPLIPNAVALLDRTLRNGGDCRILSGIPSSALPNEQWRRVQLLKAFCLRRQEEGEASNRLMLELLRENTEDDVAREAAEWVGAFASDKSDPEVMLLIGRTLHHQREFDRSIHYLRMALLNPVSRVGTFEDRYSLVRGEFWLGQYARAAAGYADLATMTRVPEERARTLFQRGRCLELMNRFKEAANVYRLAHNAEPTGSWAAAALFAAMRLEWRLGEEDPALELYGLLIGHRPWRNMAARAALFLAASDLVQGRGDRADAWLEQARRSGGRSALPEADYWQGRRQELGGEYTAAVASYLKALRPDPYHPIALAAHRRLEASRPMIEATRATALGLAGSSRTEDLHRAWLLLRGSAPGERVRQRLLQALTGDTNAAPYLNMTPVPVAQWPLWRAPLRQPEEKLLALGAWSPGAPVVNRHFPPSDPSLALTGARLLAAANDHRRSLLLVEILAQRVPRQIPFDLLPESYRSLLYPAYHRELITHHALRFEVDPNLLSAIIREESRFEHDALSAASARGLTQFVLSTARRLAPKAGLKPRVRPADLYDPPTAVALGAAYLGDLTEEFAGAEHQMVAAYNAGEPQARVWRAYCYSDEMEEYFTKVGFHETRNYLRKVLSSRAHYHELYGSAVEEPVIRESSRLAGTTE